MPVPVQWSHCVPPHSVQRVPSHECCASESEDSAGEHAEVIVDILDTGHFQLIGEMETTFNVA